jgi:hypothetical protein
LSSMFPACRSQRGALWRRVRSLIRLQRFNDDLCGCGHVVDLRSAPLPEKSSLFAKNWKLGRFIGPCPGETPRQVIESRSEIIEHVPDEHEQPIGWSVPIDDLCADISPWIILLCDNLVWVAKKSVTSSFRAFKCSSARMSFMGKVDMSTLKRNLCFLTLRITRAAGAAPLVTYRDHRAPAVGLMRLLGGLPESKRVFIAWA